MNVEQVCKQLELHVLVGEDLSREVTGGYTGDLLSWVMAHGCADMAWVTVQTHMNVIAVAALLDFACVIMPNGIKMPENVLEKAAEEDIAVLESDLDAFSICGLLYSGGVPGARKT